MFNLLQESVAPNQIIDIIKRRKVIAITYDGDAYNNLTRYIEPFVYGTTKSGKLCIIAYQRNNYSASLSGFKDGKKGVKAVRVNDRVMWRIFLLSNITSMQETKNTFDTSLSWIKANRPKYNEAYRNLSSVFFKATPDSDTLLNTLPKEENVPLDMKVFKAIVNRLGREYSKLKNLPFNSVDFKVIDENNLQAIVKISKLIETINLTKNDKGEVALNSTGPMFNLKNMTGKNIEEIYKQIINLKLA